MVSKAILMNALFGLTPTLRVGLYALFCAGVDGLGQGARVSRGTMLKLVERGLARELVGPADHPGAWRVVLNDDGKLLARELIEQIASGVETLEVIKAVRTMGGDAVAARAA